ncbi:flagellar filament capping protein FliD [Franzmannia qiaohouensis]|uniref:Flagellar hook-associated protein 2 n=1 Tax=Franzmannia qiaohouensis TaxID=1329370 RepID=A0ABU1HKQ6_9GAMM|nr:flagellar filament capping protein FliD [Halomonas qiaohouensis]MDR5907349.1 flagellar filament capping protein FliD [Halomonas qiaohouensis]
MSTITSLGVGSGLDLSGLLDQLRDAERGKLEPIKLQQTQQKAKISAYGQLQSALTKFQDAVAKVNDPKLFESLSTNVSGGEGVKASASAEANPGRYEVEVVNAARAGSLATSSVAANDQALTGADATLTLTFGKIDPDTGEPIALTLDLEEGATLIDIRNAINASEDAGVSASIVNDGTGFRLALSSKETGQDASIQGLEFTGLAGGVTLDADPATQRDGIDAEINVNGIRITSPSNSIEGAIQGVTLNLEQGTEGSTSTVVVEQNTRAVREAVTGFVDAFNALKGSISKLTAYNAETNTAGNLNGDSMVRTIESRMRSVLSGGVAGGEFATLNQVGISLQRDGTLKLDNDRLDELVRSNMAGLSDFFAGDKKDAGMAGQLNQTLGQMLGTNGIVKNTISGAESRVESLNERYARMERSIEGTISRYRVQFGQLDAMIAQMNQTSSYLTQQFDALDAQLGRGSR